MTAWNEQGQLKIDRAKEHIASLRAEVEAFHRPPEPYAALWEDEPGTGDYVVRARIYRTPPLRWGAIAGDAIHNYNSALDIVWRFAMYPAGGGRSNRREAFPIYASAERYEVSRGRAGSGRRKTALEVIRELKPYKGGNNLLWLLREADNSDKHRRPILAVSSVRSTGFDFGASLRAQAPPEWADIPSMYLDINWAKPVFPLEDGVEVWRVPANERSRLDHLKPRLGFALAFAEPEVLRGRRVDETLADFTDLVDGVVNKFSKAGLLNG